MINDADIPETQDDPVTEPQHDPLINLYIRGISHKSCGPLSSLFINHELEDVGDCTDTASICGGGLELWVLRDAQPGKHVDLSSVWSDEVIMVPRRGARPPMGVLEVGFRCDWLITEVYFWKLVVRRFCTGSKLNVSTLHSLLNRLSSSSGQKECLWSYILALYLLKNIQPLLFLVESHALVK